MFFGNTASDHVVNARAGPGYHRSTLLLSFPMLPAPHILKGSCRGIRCHQPISHPLVDQGGVRSYCTQQHREASVQHLTNAAPQTKPQLQHISVTKSFLPLCDTFVSDVLASLLTWVAHEPSQLLTFCGSTIDEKAVEELIGWGFLPSPSLPAEQPAARGVWHRTHLSTDALQEDGKRVYGFVKYRIAKITDSSITFP